MSNPSLTPRARHTLQSSYLEVFVACGHLRAGRVAANTHGHVSAQLTSWVQASRSALFEAGLAEEWIKSVQKPVVALVDECARSCEVPGFGRDWKSLGSGLYEHERLGEEVFSELKTLMQRTDVPWEILEHYLRCLALGLEGQFLKTNKPEELASLQRALAQLVDQRRPPPAALSPDLEGIRVNDLAPAVLSLGWILVSAASVLLLVIGLLMVWVIVPAREVEAHIQQGARKLGGPVEERP